MGRVLVLVLLCAACGQDAPWVADARAPRVDAVDPAQWRPGVTGVATVYGRDLKPAYNTWSDAVTQPRAFVGTRELTVTEVDGTGTRLGVEMPPDLADGLWDVRVETAHGSDTLENAVLVGL